MLELCCSRQKIDTSKGEKFYQEQHHFDKILVEEMNDITHYPVIHSFRIKKLFPKEIPEDIRVTLKKDAPSSSLVKEVIICYIIIILKQL